MNSILGNTMYWISHGAFETCREREEQCVLCNAKVLPFVGYLHSGDRVVLSDELSTWVCITFFDWPMWQWNRTEKAKLKKFQLHYLTVKRTSTKSFCQNCCSRTEKLSHFVCREVSEDRTVVQHPWRHHYALDFLYWQRVYLTSSFILWGHCNAVKCFGG